MLVEQALNLQQILINLIGSRLVFLIRTCLFNHISQTIKMLFKPRHDFIVCSILQTIGKYYVLKLLVELNDLIDQLEVPILIQFLVSFYQSLG